MHGKELIISAMRGEKLERTPWVPFVGCHAGALIGITATEYLTSKENMVKGLEEAIKRYRPDGIPVTFDLQLEAEVLGCALSWSNDNPPAVTTHPISEGKQLAELSIPKATDGRIGSVLSVTRHLRERYPELALYGLICGPFTLAMHLAGTNVFMTMYEDPEQVHQLMAFCRDVAQAMAGYYIDAGCDVIAVVDPMTSQIGPEQFVQYVTPYVSSVFDTIREKGALSSFFVCGQAQQNIEVMADCKPDNISIDENIPLDYVRDVCRKKKISFGGNLQLTVVLLLGSPEDAQKNAVECLDIGNEEGFILAPGCDLPYATPPKNIEACTEVVYDSYKREVVRTIKSEAETKQTLDMSQYGQVDKVIVDIITLDSESCAPCQYMVEAVRNVTPEFEGIVEWREHKIKQHESVIFMTSLMVKNIPTICIDGKITFVSRIPRKEELIAAIRRRVYEKLRFKIRMKKGTIFVLGKSEAECHDLKTQIERAKAELGADIEAQVITDETQRLSFGVTKTPAVVMAKYQTKSEGHVPEIPVIKEWMKDIM